MPKRLLSVALALAFSASTALAAGPQLKGQAPGWYRLQLGDFEITALNDGVLDLPVDKLLQQPAANTVRALQHAYLGLPLETSVNAYLVNTGGKLVLVDTGTAGLFGPTAGRMLDNLKASGYAPEQVDEIVITHMHGDHIGGAAATVFPNATLRLDKRDSDFWLAPEQVAKNGDGGKAIAAIVKGFADAGRFKPFEGSQAGVEIVPGVKAYPAYGHTPGHSNYVAESQGQKIMFWGDLMHVAAVQFPKPAVTVKFDSDPKAAAPAREKAYAAAAQGGYYVAVAHVSFPGIGHLRADGKGYDWLPVNYSTNR
ncbi:MBL fold metallo-hydrolase [Roseateles saccharophilus]|uniref:Glyoxylase-like metal-dependent hydrolase (Beta-lactamase superfamily II) n=1 Tax=Roseateles saccharophilus TaxID=304 RepID=A0A4R3VE44_ROSSA|nr:MBL fold metallo-hydrolase [Roseateles saccharophilus]MDG0831575.1 MBL fold metallo-hydrolase [Roseateles saccharophilus]TCV01015.1 glyoxylase-like metal-dependent hydrolase (beta-lactamase superfamily II) [Roseateles saccharophilus]